MSTAAQESKNTTSPAPEAAKPSGDALKQLMETTEFMWFASHVSTILFFILYFLGKPAKLAPLFYRLEVISAIAGFAFILRQQFATKKPTVQALLGNENAHYIALATYLLVSQRQWTLTVPFAIYSLFHALTYARSFLFPALGYDSHSSLVKATDSFIQSYNELFTTWAANFEFISLVTHLLYVLKARSKSSLISAAVYFAFFRLRFATSSYTRATVQQVEAFADSLFETFQLSEGAKSAWIKFKSLVAAIPAPEVNTKKTE